MTNENRIMVRNFLNQKKRASNVFLGGIVLLGIRLLYCDVVDRSVRDCSDSSMYFFTA